MKHLIITLVLSFTASFSMACDQPKSRITGSYGALTRSSVKPTSVSFNNVMNAKVGSPTKQQK